MTRVARIAGSRRGWWRLVVVAAAVALVAGAVGIGLTRMSDRVPSPGLGATVDTTTAAGSPASRTDPPAVRPHDVSGSELPARQGTARSATAGGPPRLVGPVDASTTIDFALALRVADQAEIDAFLASLYDPASPNYRHFLSATEFGERFGLPLSRIVDLESWARAAGLTVIGGYDQRTALRLQGTAGQLRTIFGVRLANYVEPGTGLMFHAPLNAATLPASIAEAVSGVAGLNTRPYTSASRLIASNAPRAVAAGGMGPVDLATAYDIIPLYQAGFLGEGQTIAIVSFDTYLESDITAFDEEFGIDGPAPQRVPVGAPVLKPGSGAIEVTLDIEILREVAPHAQILNFEGINGRVSQADIFDAIVQDGRADIVSDSWGRCDTAETMSSADRARGLTSLQSAVAKGISVFVASGDNGAFDCWRRDPSDQRETVDYPSASPYTIAVGGTHLNVRADGTYHSEVGWESYLSTAGTGGGINRIDKQPVWQVAPGVKNALSNGKRQSPDVSAAADPETGYVIWFTEPGDSEGSWTQVGGTSAAAPFWAGSMALVRQLALHEGVGPLGFLNPMLYALANGPDADKIFHDVTRGGNLAQQATPGWDYATGLGSPDVTALAGAIINYLNEHPAQ